MSLGLLAAVLAAVGYAVGSVLQSEGVRRAGSPGMGALARSPLYLGGLGADGLAWLLSLVALRRLPVFAVQSLLAGSLAVTVLLARVLLHHRLRRLDAIAVAVMVVALGLVAGAGHEQPAVAAPTAVSVGLLVAGVTAALAALVAARTRAPSWVHAVVAGIAFSVAALAARAVAVPADLPGDAWRIVLEPAAWAVAVGAVAGTLGYAAALERGSVGPATAVLWGVEVVVPAVVGIALLGDSVRDGWAPVTVLAVAAVVGASAVLAGAPGTAETTA
ncbi:hypothetical protein ACFFKU_14935 [Kineococcus gynurae]|uniref:Integral membrane protein n=1 Tax=Kineococcus gynurae TaxID=452979 RepID=A0ABV5LTK3_9ACTN